jgi:hypothetical protein
MRVKAIGDDCFRDVRSRPLLRSMVEAGVSVGAGRMLRATGTHGNLSGLCRLFGASPAGSMERHVMSILSGNRSPIRHFGSVGRRYAALAALLLAFLPASSQASEMASLAVEIGRTAVAMHHGGVNPRSIEPTRVIINHQGDVCHFEAIMVWTSGPFGGQIGGTPRRAFVYGSLVNRADLRRLFDLDYVEAPDRPCLGCDNAPLVITYWNTVFARQDTLSPMRELGQPLHRSQHPVCESCPPVEPQSRRPFPTEGEEVIEGEALAAIARDGSLRSGRSPSRSLGSLMRLRPSQQSTAAASEPVVSLTAHEEGLR